MSSVVPAAVLFVLTARPARLYAETAAVDAAPICTDPVNVAACSGKSANEGCTYTYGVDASTDLNAFCFPYSCVPEDGGGPVALLRCEQLAPCVTQVEVDECAGKTAGDGCHADAGRCDVEHCPVVDAGPWDGGASLACVLLPSPPPDAGIPSPAADAGSDAGVGAEPEPAAGGGGCSCDVAGSPRGVLGSVFGLLLTLVALVRTRRRARRLNLR